MSDQLLIKIAAFNYIFHQHVLLKLNITIINRILNKFSLIHIFQKSIQVNNKAMIVYRQLARTSRVKRQNLIEHRETPNQPFFTYEF